MRPALVVLNARRIPAVLSALEELEQWLPIVRLQGMTEHRISERWPEVIAGADKLEYTHLSVISDDAIPTHRAVHAVLQAARLHPVVTGWCNLDHTKSLVNLSDTPLTDATPAPHSYRFPTAWDVLAGPPIRPTFFAGLCLTTMSLGLWHRFPYGCYGEPGYAGDYSLSKRLGDAAVPIVAARDGFCHHLKAVWNTHDHTPGRELHIGDGHPERIVW